MELIRHGCLCVCQVLNMVVNGSSQRTAAPSSQGPLQPMDLPSDDKDIPQTSQSVPSTPMTMVDVNADVPKVQRQDDHLLASASHQKTKGNDADAYGLRLAARTVSFDLLPMLVFLLFIHLFIHSGYFYSTSSSPLLLRGAPNYSVDTVSELTRRSATGNHEACPRSLRGG